MQACALVLAAGFSSRMQPLFKPLLPLPVQPLDLTHKVKSYSAVSSQGTSALEIICSLYAFCAVPVLIVCGHKGDAVAAAAQRLGLPWVMNPHPEEGMFSSVRVGMTAVARHFPQCTHCFVHPVDIPLVRPMTVQAVLAVANKTACMPAAASFDAPAAPSAQLKTAHTVFMPTYAGQEGHPPLLPMTLLPQILAGQGEGGLRAVLAACRLEPVPVADSLILRDMDSPADYAAMQVLAQRRHLLDAAEADVLLAVQQLPERGRAHCRAVGAVAAAFAALLNKARVRHEQEPLLDVALARVGGLLHDVCKGQPQHEQAAGRLFRTMGQETLAWLVESHRDIDLAPASPITERELVYCADKYVQGARPVSLRQRFQQKLDMYSGNALACDAINIRLSHALTFEARLAAALGREPEAIARAALPQPASAAVR
jgi:molybdenum cofactor cytidylyltransferase